MKISEILCEAFDSKVDYDVVKQTSDLYRLEAEINGRKIKVTFSKSVGNSWDFEFAEQQGTKWTTAKTGSGGELQVFSFVKQALIEFIEIYHPEFIEFTAFEEDGSERGRIYEKFIKRLKLPDYVLDVGKSRSRNDTYFTLKRKTVTENLLDKPTPTVEEIAKKHGVPVSKIKSQLQLGIKIEMEHTSKKNVAIEIALDHLNEYPDYYDRLKKAHL